MASSPQPGVTQQTVLPEIGSTDNGSPHPDSPADASTQARSPEEDQTVETRSPRASPRPAVTQQAVLPEIDSTDNGSPHPDSPADAFTQARSQEEDQTVETRMSPRAPPSGPNLLTDVGDLPMEAGESVWMKSKKTLKYFREVHKLGKLSDLISHWHQLEEALGFPEAVSRSSNNSSCEEIS